jgi:hypothetical protein
MKTHKVKYKIVNIMLAEKEHATRLKVRYDEPLFVSRLVRDHAFAHGKEMIELPDSLSLYSVEHPRVGDWYELELPRRGGIECSTTIGRGEKEGIHNPRNTSFAWSMRLKTVRPLLAAHPSRGRQLTKPGETT